MLDFDHNATLCYQKNTENTQKNQKNKDLEIACKDYLEDKPKNKSLEKENIDK